MIDNAVIIETDTGQIELYLSDLDAMVDEITADIDEDALARPTTFLLILKKIYIAKFRPQTPLQYNGKSIILNASPEEIEKLWDWYCNLAFKYGRTPTVLQFGILTGLDRHTFQDWRDGSTRKANPAYSTLAKKMKQEAEAALESRAYESNSVSAIFGLKASHAWRETSPIAAEITPAIQHETAEQIAARYANATLPKKPDFDD